MHTIDYALVSELLEHRDPRSVSLFLPTHRTGREQQQDEIRLKNLANEAKDKLCESGCSQAEAETILRPLLALPEDEEFWRHRGDGLICYLAPNSFKSFRVPRSLKSLVYVGDRYYVRPLLPLLKSEARVYILALTQQSARLFESTQHSIRNIDLPELAQDHTDKGEPTLQLHSPQAPSQEKGATDTAIYHGQGGESDRAKTDALHFFQLVNRAVYDKLRGQNAPLMLACVGFLASLYATVNSYCNLVKAKLPGSPDRWSNDELRENAWKIVEPIFREQQREVWQEFELAESKQLGSYDLREIVLAAGQGRIDTLFLVRNEERWGQIDQQQVVELSDRGEEGEELIDYAAMLTLSNGGEVQVLDALPESESPVAAKYRY